MKTLTGNQIRKMFLDYFVTEQHEQIKSASLIPQNDPTLYFTNAGMVPFKNIFTGQEKSKSLRATTSQKCMRVSGKHNDLENVGRTARHHTFFEMLGNFSFGDYFKSDAIRFAWKFLTEIVKIPKDRLWITVFENDDEAEQLWQDVAGISKDRIFRLDEKDNFWSMGETGPCGPCSEIHFQFDACTPYDAKNGKAWFLENSESGNMMEIWNLVFMQFERDTSGKMTPLPKPSIDTGMGLERLTSVLQGQTSNYHTDLFMPLIRDIEKITQKKYTGSDAETDVSIRVLADHIRATVFLINDGVLPSNEGRGYVLRRIMRRAIRHGKLLGQTQPFFFRIVKTLIQEMSEAYPDLNANQQTIERIIQAEEERFFETLDKGLKLLAEEIGITKKSNSSILDGEVAFKLYDTFGFPLDLTELIATEHNLTVDQKGFDKAMDSQKERARAGWKGSGDNSVQKIYLELAESIKTRFLGYDTLEATASIKALIQNGQSIKSVSEGEFEFITDQTPLYGEGGGQCGDRGLASNDQFSALIEDTQKPSPQLFVHKAKLNKGSVAVGDTIQLAVDRQTRKPTMRNHTATHIMHAVLRDVLGSHVRQAGSLVNDQLLRFDFSHFEAIPRDVLQEIENRVNNIILSDFPVSKQEMSYDAAVQKGALAFFGDKYGDLVRVIAVGDRSVELCGGTHIDHSSEIGFFKITSEGSIAAGVRRIEAVTGHAAIKLAQSESNLLFESAQSLKANPNDLPVVIEKQKTRVKALEKEIEKLKAKLLSGDSNDLLKDAFEINGVKAVVIATEDAAAARDMAMAVRDKIQSGIAVVTAQTGPKAMIVVAVTKNLESSHGAQKILASLSPLIDGRGGGKADLAQAGGSNIEGLKQVRQTLEALM